MALIKNVSSSSLIYQGKCVLMLVHLTSKSNGYSSVTIYDGLNQTGTKIADLKSPANSSKDFIPPEPLHFTTGIYVLLYGDVESVSIEYEIRNN